ncbi:hypothetical protein [uncultured Deefgea sp.]|uniref:hypothetical protein n=1 Tax=uncultured Deefgea sp. TaxID=1304914 RepID=UPI00261DDEA7|nr:hypothetical protein [uncultured Deefgea sp.]
MQTQIIELFELIADGGLDHDDILAMSAEVIAAQQDPIAYRARHAADFYPSEMAVPLWEVVLLEQLADGLIFNAQSIPALYQHISEAFGEGELELQASALAELSETSALKAIQDELNPNFTLIDFSQREQMQMLLVRTHHLTAFFKLCQALNIQASIAYENRFKTN